MRQETIKLELIEWLAQLNDIDLLNYLKVVKDSKAEDADWWNDLTASQKQGIDRGLEDIHEGRVVSHSDVKRRYGL
jgi:hypothetical protein